ncbi:hypothetical protein [Pilibacter termitis]|uniref:hypothetical protein n=1 Tax=Pilibacter termitis TaxID=263852 RepID=UPI000998F3F3|nr:hypothetical protein [Pilibacter termitis]
MKNKIGRKVLANSVLLQKPFILKIEQEYKNVYVGEIIQCEDVDEMKVKDYCFRIAVKKRNVRFEKS